MKYYLKMPAQFLTMSYDFHNGWSDAGISYIGQTALVYSNMICEGNNTHQSGWELLLLLLSIQVQQRKFTNSQLLGFGSQNVYSK